MKTRSRTSVAGPLTICLLALVALAALILLVLHLLAPGPIGTHVEHPLAVEMGEDWENWFLTTHSTEEQQAYLDQTVEDVRARGGNVLLLTGRAGGGLLFRSKDKALPTLSTITANDRLFHKKFDPVLYLAEKAEDAGVQVALLATDTTGNPLNAEAVQESLAQPVAQFADKYNLAVFAPKAEPVDKDGAITAYTDGESVLLRADGKPGLLAAAVLDSQEAGAVLGEYTALRQDGTDALLYLAFTGDAGQDEEEGQVTLLSRSIPQTLGIAYPAQGAVVYTEQVFVMGTSDPGQTLTVNGAEVARPGAKGVWGVLVDAQMGDNTVTVAQGGQEMSVAFTRREPTWAPITPTSDGSGPAKWGQKLRITATLASVLEAPANPDSIQMTAYEGAVAEVAQSLPLTYNGKKTYAYQLQSGHFVLAKDCELLDDEPDAAFTGIQVQELENGDQVLTLQGAGTPLYYHQWEDGVLTLSFYSASFTGQWPSGTGFVTSFEQGEVNTGFSVAMAFSQGDPLWGYHVDYVDGGTQIYLKRAPQRSEADTGPLTGVTVMLDAGHGEGDDGAMGCAGSDAPQEKDVNLALAHAAQHRLEQLGATVLMTRTDDTFYTLNERVAMLNQEKPDFFIAVHHNSATLDQDMNENGGVEAYWFYTEGKPLAQNLVEAVGETTGRRQRGVFYNYFYVTRSNICPAVLLETGFVTVPLEYEQVADEQTLWAEGGAIAQAVLRSVPQ